MKLQGKEQYVKKLYEHVQAFIQKFELIQKQLINKKVVHFTTLSTYLGLEWQSSMKSILHSLDF